MKDFFSSRVTLITKTNQGQFRPIQCLNLPLRLFEKSLLSVVRSCAYSHTDSIYGFVPHRSTHMAYNDLRDHLENNLKSPTLFIDFPKAFNCASRKKLSKIIKNKRNGLAQKLLIQILEKHNVDILGEKYQSDSSVPQGSSLSPILFNHLIDSLISDLIAKQPNLKVIAYADDMAIIGRVDLKHLTQIALDHGLQLNKRKCITFNNSLIGIPK